MNFLQRTMSMLAGLGIQLGRTAPNGDFAIQQFLGQRHSKHTQNKTGVLAGHRSKARRYRIARGAGSISAKADITALDNAGLYLNARLMAEAHERQCGERLFPHAWWRNPEATPL